MDKSTRDIQRIWLLGMIYFSLLMICILLITGCATNREVSYLFLQHAGGGTLEQASGENYIITLNNISEITMVFADRPIRQAFPIHTDEFTSAFDEFFGDEPPNAALNFRVDDGGTQVDAAVFVLSEPRYDVDARTLTYSAVLIPLDEETVGVTSDDRPLTKLPAKFEDASLFIDPTDVKITYVNNSLNPDQPTIFVFSKNLVPTFDVLVDG